MTNNHLSILVIDQGGEYAVEVKHGLERQTHKIVEVVVEPDLKKALQRMSDREFDVVLAKRDALNSIEPRLAKNSNHKSRSIVGTIGDERLEDGFSIKTPVRSDVLTELIINNIEKSELKASLETIENNLRKIIEKNADSILVVDRNGALLFWNPAAEKLFKNSNLIGGELFGIPLIAGETTELDIVGSSGERIVTEMRVVDIDWSGQSACLASLRDVTQRKVTEELLETKVQDRTRELEDLNKELRQMYESADSAARVRSQFIATFSHEVRTPLGGIVAASEMLPMADNLEEFRELATSVFNSSKQLLKLVESILDFSKLESGAVPLSNQDFDLRTLLDSILQATSKMSADNSVSVRQQVDDSVPNTVSADPVKIRQVVLNLVHNAIKFTKNGTVEIDAQLQNKDGEHVLKISIKDSGIGMSPQECESIFQPFVQGNRKIHAHYGGTGLGLSICKQLVEAMDGSIGFCSEQGKGSTFWFTIPVAIK